jgi:hypothetical protein
VAVRRQGYAVDLHSTLAHALFRRESSGEPQYSHPRLFLPRLRYITPPYTPTPDTRIHTGSAYRPSYHTRSTTQALSGAAAALVPSVSPKAFHDETTVDQSESRTARSIRVSVRNLQGHEEGGDFPCTLHPVQDTPTDIFAKDGVNRGAGKAVKGKKGRHRQEITAGV